MEDRTTVLSNFKIKLVIDTQILAYLVDKTYPLLNSFFDALIDCEFVQVSCSKFSIYEFVGVRKLEHYLREIHGSTIAKGGVMNFSSTLKYKNDWTAPELPYESIFSSVKTKVESDLTDLQRKFDICYDDIDVHTDIWKPHQDLVLSSKLSKEDSLILVSSIYPDSFTKEDHVVFLTNDQQFYKAFCGASQSERMDEIDTVFSNHGLNLPSVYRLSELTLEDKTKFDLKSTTETRDIVEFAKNFVLEHIAKKAKSLYLGTVVACEAAKEHTPKLLCFELDAMELKQNSFLVIITKDLVLQYCHPVGLSEFWCYGEIKTYPYKPETDKPDSKKISIQITDINGDRLAIMDRLQVRGNLVFTHPDSALLS